MYVLAGWVIAEDSNTCMVDSRLFYTTTDEVKQDCQAFEQMAVAQVPYIVYGVLFGCVHAG